MLERAFDGLRLQDPNAGVHPQKRLIVIVRPVLSDLFILRGVPEHIRSDGGSDFIEGGARMDHNSWRDDRLHRTGLTLGERLLRELQLQDPGRTPERRNVP